MTIKLLTIYNTISKLPNTCPQNYPVLHLGLVSLVQTLFETVENEHHSVHDKMIPRIHIALNIPEERTKSHSLQNKSLQTSKANFDLYII